MWCQFQLARSQACSARSPRSIKFHFSGGEGASGLNGLALSERPLRALPYVVYFSSLGSKPARPESREFYNLIFPGGRLRLGPNILHLIKERMVLYLLVSLSARAVPGLLGQIFEKYKISLFREGGCVWAQWFGIVRKTAEGSTLCCLFQLARFQARSARKPRNLQFDFSGDEIASGAQFFAFDKRAYGALPFGLNFSSLGLGLLGQISDLFSILLFRGGGCVWAQWFGIVRKTAEGSTFCCQFQLARFQARSARKPRILEFDNSVGEIASGAQFFAFDKRAYGALPFGFNFSSLGPRAARPDLREI